MSSDKTQSGYDVIVDLTKSTENYVLIAALYDEKGNLISAESADTDGEAQYVLNIQSEKAGKSIKVFLWNSISDIMPICESEEIYI